MLLRALVLTVLVLWIGSPARAATFQIGYYDYALPLPDPLIGTGTFSYDGAATAGSFALDTLSGITFEATILGHDFTTADLSTDLSQSAISVVNHPGGLRLIFTGSGGTVVGTSFELLNDEEIALLHCCGDTGTYDYSGVFDPGTFNLEPPLPYGHYFAFAVPEPGTFALFALGLAALTTAPRRLRG